MQKTIKTIRENLGYSYEDMAVKLNIPIGIYKYYEKFPKVIPASIAIKIAGLGAITVNDIFFE